MPLTTNCYLNLTVPVKSKTGITTYELECTEETYILQDLLSINYFGFLIQEYDYKELDANIYQDLIIRQYYISLRHIIEFLQRLYTLEQLSIITTSMCPISQVDGTYDSWVNLKKLYVKLFQTLKHAKLISRPNLEIKEPYHIINTTLYKCHPNLHFEEQLTLSDETGPRPINIYPVPGTVYNNPLDPIEFNFIDQEGSNVVKPSIYIYINNNVVVSGGNLVNPLVGISGVVTLDEVNLQNYKFKFIPSSLSPLSDDSPVVVSGSAVDSHIPANYGSFSYSYEVWSTKDLIGYIFGGDDEDIPYLCNLNPSIGQIEVGIDSNIFLEIIDAHTGLNTQSVIIEVDGEVVISGGALVNNTFGTVILNNTNNGRGRSYEINPSVNFKFWHPVQVRVYAEDLFTPSINILDTTYSFTTTSNAHLTVSGLKIYSDSVWKDFNIDEAYPITLTGVQFRTKYINQLETGVNVTNSKVKLNNIDLVSNFQEVTPNKEYDVFFNVIPDYKTESNLTFYIEQETPVSGNILFNNFYSLILWGAEYCYDNETKFSYDTRLPVAVQVYNYGDRSFQDALVYSFNTVPMPSLRLHGEIYPINPPSDFIQGYLESHNNFFEYGKTLNFEVEAKDFAGNILNYKWTLKIEERI